MNKEYKLSNYKIAKCPNLTEDKGLAFRMKSYFDEEKRMLDKEFPIPNPIEYDWLELKKICKEISVHEMPYINYIRALQTIVRKIDELETQMKNDVENLERGL